MIELFVIIDFRLKFNWLKVLYINFGDWKFWIDKSSKIVKKFILMCNIVLNILYILFNIIFCVDSR